MINIFTYVNTDPNQHLFQNCGQQIEFRRRPTLENGFRQLALDLWLDIDKIVSTHRYVAVHRSNP